VQRVYAGLGGQVDATTVVMKAFWNVLVSQRPNLVDEFQVNPFCFTNLDDLSVAAIDVVEELGDTVKEPVKEFYKLSDRHLLYFDDSSSTSATLALVHPCDIALYALQFCTAHAPGVLSQAQLMSLLSPGGMVTGGEHSRVLNELLVARSLATNTDGWDLVGASSSVKFTVPPHPDGGLRLVRRVPTADHLSIDQQELWTGELFKEHPDGGADLVAIVEDVQDKKVMVVRVSVKLGNPNSQVCGQADTKTLSAKAWVRDLQRKEQEVIATMQPAVKQCKGADYTVEVLRVVATVRKVTQRSRNGKLPAKGVFEEAAVSVLDRDALAPHWIPAIKEAAKTHDLLSHYREQRLVEINPDAQHRVA